jgi:hypothetical protein
MLQPHSLADEKEQKDYQDSPKCYDEKLQESVSSSVN